MVMMLFACMAIVPVLLVLQEIYEAIKDARRVNKLVEQLPAVWARYNDAKQRAHDLSWKNEDATEAKEEARKAYDEYRSIVNDKGLTRPAREKLAEEYPIEGFRLWY